MAKRLTEEEIAGFKELLIRKKQELWREVRADLKTDLVRDTKTGW